MSSVRLPGPIVLWSPDATRFACLEESRRLHQSEGDGAEGYLWLFERDARGAFAGRRFDPLVRYDETPHHATPPDRLPRWSGDGEGLCFETWDGEVGCRVQRLDVASRRVETLAESSGERGIALLATVPHDDCAALRFGAASCADLGPARARSHDHGIAVVRRGVHGPEWTVIADRDVRLATFAPERRRAVVLERGAPHGLRLVSISLHDRTRRWCALDPAVQDLEHPVWSPNGRRIAFVAETEGNIPWQFAQLVADLGDDLDVEPRVTWVHDPERSFVRTDWLPDSHALVRLVTSRLALLRAIASADLEALLPDAEDGIPVAANAWLRAVSRFASWSTRRAVHQGAAVYRDELERRVQEPTPPPALEIADRDGGAARILLQLPADTGVQWLQCSPDGRFVGLRLSTSRLREEPEELLLAGLESDGDRRTVVMSPTASDPSWIDGGRTLVWATHTGQSWELVFHAL